MHADAVIVIPFDEVAVFVDEPNGIRTGFVAGEADVDAVDGTAIGIRFERGKDTYFVPWRHESSDLILSEPVVTWWTAQVARAFEAQYARVIREKMREWRDGKADRIGDQMHDQIKHG